MLLYFSLNTIKFVIEIEERPAIWNNNDRNYFNRVAKHSAWVEVGDIFKITGKLNQKYFFEP